MIISDDLLGVISIRSNYRIFFLFKKILFLFLSEMQWPLFLQSSPLIQHILDFSGLPKPKTFMLYNLWILSPRVSHFWSIQFVFWLLDLICFPLLSSYYTTSLVLNFTWKREALKSLPYSPTEYSPIVLETKRY